MNPACNEIQEKLSALVPGDPLDPLVEQHVHDCLDCSDFFLALRQIDGAWQELPAYDAHEAQVRALLVQVEHEAQPRIQVEPGPLLTSASTARGASLIDQVRRYARVLLRPSFGLPLAAVAALFIAAFVVPMSLNYSGDRQRSSGYAPAEPQLARHGERGKLSQRQVNRRAEVDSAPVPAVEVGQKAAQIDADDGLRDDRAGDRQEVAEQEANAPKRAARLQGKGAAPAGRPVVAMKRNGAGGAAAGGLAAGGRLEERPADDLEALAAEDDADFRAAGSVSGPRKQRSLDKVTAGEKTDAKAGRELGAASADASKNEVAGSELAFGMAQDERRGKDQRNRRAAPKEAERVDAATALKPVPAVPAAPPSVISESKSARLRDSLADAEPEGNEDAALKKKGADTGRLESDLAQAEGGAAAACGDKRSAEHYCGVAGQNGASSSALALFQQERSTIDGLTFQEPHGYWANTYLPGDPAIRILQGGLVQADRSALQAFASTPLQLEDSVRRVTQPFDAPADAALSLFLRADHKGLSEPTRMLVQVGVQATSRFGGRRPAMNVGLVLDLRGEISAETAAKMRALVLAFAQAKEMDDRFSLTVAGRGGGLLVPVAEFKTGALSLRLQEIFECHMAESECRQGPEHTIVEATREAQQVVFAADDPNAPLGSSLVMLITAQPLGDDTESLRSLAHESAVAGVPVSVVGIDQAVRLAELDRIALAGQGNRRLLTAGSDATALVDNELASVGRAVARVVRLNIRLAPNVKLIDVLGSRRLDDPEAQRVREAEQSIDRRTARNLGIAADRGADEDGIQIVLPTLYSGDSHVILLDVVAPGPGALVEVTARYKDIAFMRNATARASLALDRNDGAPGPLERNLLKNLLARRFSASLAQAGDALQNSDTDSAITSLRDMADLLRGLQRETPELARDADLSADIGLLDEYLHLLQSPAVQVPGPRAYLSSSLELSSHLKLQNPR